MALLKEWREYAYSEEMQNSKEGQKLWENYFTLEKGIYENNIFKRKGWNEHGFITGMA